MIFYKYLLDITRFNVLFFVLVWLISTLNIALGLSATLGMFVSLGVFHYFQEIEYYFYRNAGWSKWALFSRAWINLTNSCMAHDLL
ncbi:hypothetical protein GA0116948_108116 [Chitinophaga costaii]|uniref:Uncharacterized protein n=1 Tax=Chitinophaga costaii TaxID=1335309 RepID=A0A1C4EHJ4_9BACT|nr:hypothetical protein [Chitinophaga costaii]PUZ23819.1 hypothetical protein DCM91_13565 [Chitinophaga costaii]SCC43010.1 hypothetical protein GA0116948_108116 [Chitinophaga costaii]